MDIRHNALKKNDWVLIINNHIKEFSNLTVLSYNNKCFLLSNGLLLTDKESASLIRKICNKTRSKTIENYFDNLYHIDPDIRIKTVKEIRTINAKNAAYKNIEKNGKNVAKGLFKFRANNKNFRSGFGLGGIEPWNKGKSKYDDIRLLNNSIRMKGDLNPSKKFGVSLQTRKKISTKVKENILSGKFTPSSNNRNKNFDCFYKNQKYRSSWEACFHSIFPEYEYEKLRIEYIDENMNKRVYIVDFVCHIKKIAIEVKPDSMFEKNPELIIKEKALQKWCDNNSYSYIRWNENKFRNYKNDIDLSLFNESISRKIRGLIETFK